MVYNANILMYEQVCDEHSPRFIEYPSQQRNFASNAIITSRYTWYNFIFKNIFEQFHRLANVFFLFMAIIQAIPAISPLNPSAGFVSLVLMLSITAVKQGYEDFLRHRTDKTINEKNIPVWSHGTFYMKQWKDVSVGDIISVNCDEEFPADCVLLELQENEKRCRIETAALDGETNLKFKIPINVSKETCFSLEISPPSQDLNHFSGKLTLNGEKITVGISSFIPRGCFLRNTRNISAIVVFTGNDTKLILNSQKPQFKYTELDKIMFFISGVLLTALCLIAAGMTIGSYFWSINHYDAGYLQLNHLTKSSYALQWFSWVIDLQMIIPLAVYSSLDVVRFLISLTINFDKEMRENGKTTNCRNSDLVSSIGRVTHIFTDKTGTLTKNQMTFRAVSFHNVVLGIGTPTTPVQHLERLLSIDDSSVEWIKSHIADPNVTNFLLAICMCTSAVTVSNPVFYPPNTVSFKNELPSPEDVSSYPYSISYQTSSPDELALLHFARECGFILYNSTEDKVEIIINGVLHSYERSMMFEFTSIRKRFSAVSKVDENYHVFIKGADTVLIPLCSSFSSTMQERLDQMGRTGLRTLTYGHRTMGIDEYNSLKNQYYDAKSMAVDSEDAVTSIAEQVEKKLDIFAFSGVDDELQENVIETFDKLKRANIKIWMLTGDRMDTAINIAKNARLIEPDCQIKTMEELSIDDDFENTVIVADNINSLFSSDSHFSRIEKCATIICARCEPSQKGNCVRKFMNLRPKSVLLAIGDGANDVDMIRAANVGVGVEGKEGTDAVISSDFSIPSFHHISKLLICHGRWSANRTSLLILITFYKNLLLGLPQLFYGFYNGFSATSIFDSGYFAMYNVVLTIPQHFFVCMVEKDIDSRISLEFPEVYKDFQKHGGFDLFDVIWYYIIAFIHSALIFFTSFIDSNEVALNSDGDTLSHAMITQVVGWTLMFIFTFELLMRFKSLTWLHVVFYLGCLMSNIFIEYFYQFAEEEYTNIFNIVIQTPRLWFGVPIAAGISVIIDMIYWFIVPIFHPTISQAVLEYEKLAKSSKYRLIQ